MISIIKLFCFQFDLTSLDRKLITSDRRSRYTADVFNIMSFQIAYTNTEGIRSGCVSCPFSCCAYRLVGTQPSHTDDLDDLVCKHKSRDSQLQPRTSRPPLRSELEYSQSAIPYFEPSRPYPLRYVDRQHDSIYD